eukprot:6159947-Amphidinium_carterae.1
MHQSYSAWLSVRIESNASRAELKSGAELLWAPRWTAAGEAPSFAEGLFRGFWMGLGRSKTCAMVVSRMV